MLKHMVEVLLSKEKESASLELEQRQVEIGYELDPVVRASLETQLEKSIMDMCLRQRADRSTIDERLNQLMGQMSSMTSNVDSEPLRQEETPGAAMDAVEAEMEDLEYDILFDDDDAED